jgi:hypothetical protein
MVDQAMHGKRYSRNSLEIHWLEAKFVFTENEADQPPSFKPVQLTLPLFE